MSLVVCTGWNLDGWHLYGRRFLESFSKFWPAGVKLYICGEGDACAATASALMKMLEAGTLRHRVDCESLDAIPGCLEFLKRSDTPIRRGRLKQEGHNWKERAVAAGYNWRYDAHKFSRQGFIPWHIAQQRIDHGADFLCWLDGDVVTDRPIAHESVITRLLPPDKAIAYLGREPKHPDIAFQLYRLGTPLVSTFLREFSVIYSSDSVFKLKEWHSAYVWHHILQRPCFLPIAHNLTPGGTGHVWHQSPLRQWGDHLKGERKKHGRSPERRTT